MAKRLDDGKKAAAELAKVLGSGASIASARRHAVELAIRLYRLWAEGCELKIHHPDGVITDFTVDDI